MHKMHKFCEYYSVFNHRMTWNHDWIQSWTTWKRPYVKKQFEKFFIFFMDISIHDSLSIHFKITWKSSFSLCTWTLFLGIQTSTYFLSIFWKTPYSVAMILQLASFSKSWQWHLMAEFEEEKRVSTDACHFQIGNKTKTFQLKPIKDIIFIDVNISCVKIFRQSITASLVCSTATL